MWDSVLKLGKVSFLPLSSGKWADRKSVACSPLVALVHLPQLPVRLSSAQRLASASATSPASSCPSFPAPCMAEVERVEAGGAGGGGSLPPCSRLLLTAGGQT